MSVDELEKAILELPEDELSRLAGWLEEHMAFQWDKQIEQDVESGKLESLLTQVDRDIDSGRAAPL